MLHQYNIVWNPQQITNFSAHSYWLTLIAYVNRMICHMGEEAGYNPSIGPSRWKALWFVHNGSSLWKLIMYIWKHVLLYYFTWWLPNTWYHHNLLLIMPDLLSYFRGESRLIPSHANLYSFLVGDHYMNVCYHCKSLRKFQICLLIMVNIPSRLFQFVE